MTDKPRHRVYAGTNSEKINNSVQAFTFGEAKQVLSTSYAEYLGVHLGGVLADNQGSFYNPPVSLVGLAKVMNANAHHCSALHFKKNLLTKWYKPSTFLPLADFKKVAFEKVLFDQFYLQKIYNAFNEWIAVRHLPGVNMRRIKGKDQYLMLIPGKEPLIFKPGEVLHHITGYDPLQQIYSMPEYLGGLQSILLNENATLFRRRYYENGNHAGFIFYTADPDMDEPTANDLKDKISGTKGVGNFKSMFINIPNGREKSVQIIPIGDVSTKDEFERIKNVTRNDILSVHRIHRDLAAVMPEESGGSGDILKISQVCYENEVVPMQLALQEINPLLPSGQAIAFEKPESSNG